ncbi:Autoinducer 2 sensor kinase/phosphatase LuxQ [Symmachiella dynata]|uniref:histidine kinase n=2 Tax=Symmachiella dynata TaxID=2527995 RepID=A0A517ZV62_9PLAN|nr:Autoinducer 2 sensor kinase/phosphatase LuxQ [Symmachiella dynata]
MWDLFAENAPPMKIKPRSTFASYGLAVVFTGLATGLQLLAHPYFGGAVPYIPFCLAVFATALIAKAGPTLLAILLSDLAVLAWFLPPPDSLLPADTAGWLGLMLFSLFGICVAILSDGRRHKTEQFQGERERFLATLSSIEDGVIVTDSNGQVTFLNTVAEGITGTGNAAAQGKPLDVIFRLINESSRQPIENLVDRADREGHDIGLSDQSLLIADDGTEKAIEGTVAPIRTQVGKFAGCVIVYRDVTERRRLEREGATSVETSRLLAAIITSSNDAIISKSLDGMIQSWNTAAERIFGFTAEQAIGHHISILIPAERAEEENRIIAQLRKGQRVEHFDTVRLRSDGQRVFVSLTISPVRNAEGQIIGASKIARDITKQKKAEERLRESEERFIQLGNAIPQMAWMAQPDGHIDWYNDRWYEYTGTTFQEMEGWGWQSVPAPNVLPEVMQRWQKALESGEPFNMVFPLRGADGEFRPFLTQVLPFRNGEGKITRWFGTNTDISAIKRTEDELREARSRLESTLAAAEIGTWEFDAVKNTVRADPNLARMFDVSLEDEASNALESYLKAIHPDDQKRVTEGIEQAIKAGSTYENEFRIVGSGNEVRWVVARGRVERDNTGQAIRLPGVAMDISERKQVEKALQESKEQFRLALDSAELGTWSVNPATYHLTCDERFRIIFHGCADPITYDQAIAAIHPDDQQRIRDAVAKAIRPDNPARYAQEYRIVQPNGTNRWVFAKGRANFEPTDAGQRLVSFDGTLMDITQQRKMQEELRELASRLAETDRRKDEFLATLAHELRNPLAPIRTGLEIMKSVMDDPETMEDIRCTMERQTQQLIMLVDDLLDVSRISKGKLKLRKCRVKLADVIQSAVEASNSFIDESNHKLITDIPSEPIYLNADPNRLAQVVSNLLNNSIKYTPEGGRIRLSAERQENDVVVSVEDNGLGIPAEMLDRIFEMFAQIDRPQEKGYTGLGIGLSLVKSLVELHQGQIEVHSEGIGKGSLFSVRLPIHIETHAEEPTLSRIDQTATESTNRKVLVVDDNKAGAKMLSMIVKMLGNDVRKAYDGQEGIEVAEDFLPDVILMDIGMPKMNGYEAARYIRQQPWGNKIMLVALTGWGQDEDKQKTKAAGFDHHLVKPAEPAAIQELLENVNSNPKP